MAMKTRNRLLTLKIEATPGVEAPPSASTDALRVESLTVSPKIAQIQTNELSGSLDGSAPIAGGAYVVISGTVPVKGSGSAGVAPEWGDLLKIGAMTELLTAAAVPVAAELVGAGAAAQATLGASAAAVAQAYRGMPIALTVNPVAGALSFPWDYSAAKVAKLTDTFTAPLDGTTKWQLLPNVLYSPASVSIPTATAHCYLDGKRWRVVGCRASRLSFSGDAGGIFRLAFEIQGILAAIPEDDVAVPAAVFDAVLAKPVWRAGSGGAGAFTLNSLPAAPKTLSLDFGLQLQFPENPNASEGFDVPEIIGRSISGRCDPQATLVATRDLFAAARGGAVQPLHARCGTVAGNRFALTVPQAQFTDFTQGDRSGITTDEVAFFCSGNDAAAAAVCLY